MGVVGEEGGPDAVVDAVTGLRSCRHAISLIEEGTPVLDNCEQRLSCATRHLVFAQPGGDARACDSSPIAGQVGWVGESCGEGHVRQGSAAGDELAGTIEAHDPGSFLRCDAQASAELLLQAPG